MASKFASREEAQRKKEQAAAFMERLGEPDRANEFDSMSVDQYAERRGLQLTNRRNKDKGRRNCYMASNGSTKADLQSQLDDIEQLLDDVYQPESSREDLVSAVSQALDILREGDEDQEEDEDDASDDDED